jgi:hypothetical protein
LTNKDNSKDWVFNGGSGILSLSIGLNAVSGHAACTAIFVVVAALIGFMFGSIRTLGKIKWIAWVGLSSIITAGKLKCPYRDIPCVIDQLKCD